MKNNATDAEVLRKEIRDQSEQEASGILEQAEKEVGRVIAEARADGAKTEKAVLKKAESQADAVRKRILSGVHLEVKRQELRAREEIVKRILSTVGEKLEAFRGTKAYPPVLERLVVEGVTALDGDAFRIEGGRVEKELLTKTVISGIREKIEKATNREVSLSVGKDVIEEGGLVITSSDGRMHFDNRFSARMERTEIQMRLEIAKRMFE